MQLRGGIRLMAKKEKPVHLRINNFNRIAACGKNRKRLTVNINEVTCPGCVKRIELIWVMDIYVERLSQMVDELCKFKQTLKELYKR